MHYSLTRATVWNLAGYLYLIIASFISIPLLVSGLGVGYFGQYSLIIASLSLVSAINLGLPQSVVRALAHEHSSIQSRNSIWATSSQLFIMTGFFGAIVSTLFTYTFHVKYEILPLVFGLGLMNSVVAHYSTLPHAEGHFGYYNAKTFIVGTGNTLIAAYLASHGYALLQILSAQLICYLLTMFVLVFFSRKYFPTPWLNKPSRAVAKSLIRFGLKNQVGTFMGQVQAQYGKYLLGFVSPLSLSAYVISTGLVQKAVGGVVQLATAIYPAVARKSDISTIRGLYYRLQAGLFLSAVMSGCAYYLIGLSFLTWWLASPKLVSIVDGVMRVLVWYLAILVVSPLASSILDSRGKPEITSFFAFVTTTIEISLALLMLSKYGLFAPVYASLIALLITTPFLLLTTDRIIRVKS